MMMTRSTLKYLEESIQFISRQLTRIDSLHGAQSPEYKRALKEFADAWFSLKQRRPQSDFLSEVS